MIHGSTSFIVKANDFVPTIFLLLLPDNPTSFKNEDSCGGRSCPDHFRPFLPVVMGWNANKGVLFGQELRSDSHGSNPSVSWMLKLCSSNDNANEWYMDQPVSLSKQTTLSRPFFFFFFQIIPPPSKMKILVEEEVVPTISVPFRQCRTLWSTSRLILWLGSRSTRPMTADFRLIKTVHGWPPVLQA